MYQPKMKAAIGRPSRAEHDKNPCIVCPSILGGIFRPAPASSRRPNPAAAAGWRVAGAAPRRAQLRSLPAGVVATESLSCLCILGHRLRFDIGFAFSNGHNRADDHRMSECGPSLLGPMHSVKGPGAASATP